MNSHLSATQPAATRTLPDELPHAARLPCRLNFVALTASSRPLALVAEPAECGQWAAAGECSRTFVHAATAPGRAPRRRRRRPIGTPSPSSAPAGRRTASARATLAHARHLPAQLREQRASVVAGSTRRRAASTRRRRRSAHRRIPQAMRRSRVLELCEDEADPPECRRALRCRELKDDGEECAAKAKAGAAGRDRAAPATSATATSRAPSTTSPASRPLPRQDLGAHARARLLGTRARGGRRAAERRAAAAAAVLAGTLDPRPPATCTSPRAALVHRWRRLGVASPRSRSRGFDGGQERLPLGRRAARPVGRRRRAAGAAGGGAPPRAAAVGAGGGGAGAPRCASCRL